jgi:hypothetical protein
MDLATFYHSLGPVSGGLSLTLILIVLAVTVGGAYGMLALHRIRSGPAPAPAPDAPDVYHDAPTRS